MTKRYSVTEGLQGGHASHMGGEGTQVHTLKNHLTIVAVDVGVRGRGEAMLELVGVVSVDPLALVGEQKGEGER